MAREVRLFDRFEFWRDYAQDWRWKRLTMKGNLVDESHCGFKDKADAIADACEYGYKPGEESNGK